uniref:VHS domain-containing protein n=1 Tax=Gopherus agassizii TaxID=38772 RepID=A0A452I9F0_9SAUR
LSPQCEPLLMQLVKDRATNPLNKDLDWDSINAFCEQLNKELEGPPLATRLLAHKIQSPQEWEAIQALTVRERLSRRVRQIKGQGGECPVLLFGL